MRRLPPSNARTAPAARKITGILTKDERLALTRREIRGGMVVCLTNFKGYVA
jgi:hypothetical protein